MKARERARRLNRRLYHDAAVRRALDRFGRFLEGFEVQQIDYMLIRGTPKHPMLIVSGDGVAREVYSCAPRGRG